jgi:hypothetical protein
MSDQNTTSGDPTNPQPPCAKCKSTDHTTGFHGSGKISDGKQTQD